MNNKTEEDIKLIEATIIDKWQKIVEGVAYNRGRYDCPLCVEYLQHRCKGCPIYEDTGRVTCIATPFTAWIEHHEKEHDDCPKQSVHCSTCLQIAKHMVNYLSRLRDKLKTQFTPFNFRIETRAMADLLYYKLDHVNDEANETFSTNPVHVGMNAAELSTELWQAYDQLYSPFK